MLENTNDSLLNGEINIDAANSVIDDMYYFDQIRIDEQNQLLEEVFRPR